MLILITGGSGSGKSSYAESYIDAVSKGMPKYYLATMQVFDEDGRRKVERHRELRKGKGFVTIEQPFSIEEALERMKPGRKAALLECMSNLTANEMFGGSVRVSGKQAADQILQGIGKLQKELEVFVIVTNNVFEDGILYEKSTREYMEALASVNSTLAAMADVVIEVVAGIPVVLKKGEYR